MKNGGVDVVERGRSINAITRLVDEFGEKEFLEAFGFKNGDLEGLIDRIVCVADVRVDFAKGFGVTVFFGRDFSSYFDLDEREAVSFMVDEFHRRAA